MCASLQAQYVFIHDSLSELVVCGETEIVAADIRIKMNHLKRRVAGDMTTTGFQKQFQVLYIGCVQVSFNHQWRRKMIFYRGAPNGRRALYACSRN